MLYKKLLLSLLTISSCLFLCIKSNGQVTTPDQYRQIRAAREAEEARRRQAQQDQEKERQKKSNNSSYDYGSEPIPQKIVSGKY
jgi:hypothetical protein